MTNNINDTLNTILNLLDEQKGLLVPAQREPLPLVEQFGRLAEHERVEVSNGTDCPDFRDVYYFLDSEDVYNSGYRSGGTWVDGWWA